MSHNKSESGGDLLKALCRFVKILPTGLHVTFGSGCIVLKSGPPPSADLITTTQVLTKNDLLGDSSIFIQFLNNKWFQLKLKSRDAANLPDSKPGRVLRDIEGNEDRVSFLRIPVDMFDPRMWLTRKIWPMEKLALCCFYPSDENLKTSISNNDITCNVISEDRKDRRFYITEPSYLRFGTDPGEFALLSVSDTDCASPAKTLKNFATEEKPKGAPLLDAKGRLVGMLAVARSGERKVYPVFLPTLTGDSNNHGLGDEKISDADMMSFQNKIFRLETDEKEQHNNHSPKNPVSKEFRNEDKEAQTGTTDRQGSASPSSSPLHESSPEAKLGNGSAQEQHESGSSHRPDNGEETSSGEVESNSSADMANQNQPHDDPSTSSVPEDNSAPKQRTDQEQDETVSLQRPKNRDESSSEVDENSFSGSFEVENHGQSQDDSRSLSFQEDDEKSSPEETENSSRELEEPHDYASMFEEQDQEGGNTGYGHANNEISIRDEPDGKNKETDPQVDNYADEDVSQTLAGQARIPTLATQNYCHDQFSDPDYFHDDEGYGVRETPSLPPEKDRPPRNHSSNGQSRHGDTDLPSLPRSQSDVFGPGTPNQSPRTTRHNTIPSKQLEHILPGSFLKDKIVSREDAMDVLILHLDRSVCLAPGIPATQRWEHLADQFKVPDDVKSQCANFSGKLSSSESLFEHICATQDSLTMKEVKNCLKKLGRNDVVAELEKNTHLKDESTVTDLYEQHSETLCSICMKLDDKRSIKYWYDFGIAIGIKAGTLRRLRDPSRDSPSEMVLQMIQTRKPRLPLEKLVADINLPGIAKALADFPDNSTIETLLGDMDAMENVTTLLDPDRKWQRVGQHYNIDQRILDNLKPGDFQSPTKTMLEYIVKREPNATVDTFLRSLLNINRSDVIEDLREIFYGDDIERILRAGGPVPL